MDASMEELARCPGVGEWKVKRLHDTFHKPFKRVTPRPNLVVPDTPDREKASGQPSSTNNGTPEKPGTSENKKGSDVKSARSQGRLAAHEAGEGPSSSTMEGDKTKQLD